MEKPTRKARDLTVRLLFPWSRIKKKSAEPKLPRIRRNATAITIFMAKAGNGKKLALVSQAKVNKVTL